LDVSGRRAYRAPGRPRRVHARDGAHVGVHTAAFDHIAFRGIDIEATRATLLAHDLKFREAGVPGGRLQQIFVSDPDGILVELNFRSAASA